MTLFAKILENVFFDTYQDLFNIILPYLKKIKVKIIPIRVLSGLSNRYHLTRDNININNPSTEEFSRILIAAWQKFYPRIPDKFMYVGVASKPVERYTQHTNNENDGFPGRLSSRYGMVAFETPSEEFARKVESALSNPLANKWKVYFWDYRPDLDGNHVARNNSQEEINEGERRLPSKYIYLGVINPYYLESIERKRGEEPLCINWEEAYEAARQPIETPRQLPEEN